MFDIYLTEGGIRSLIRQELASTFALSKPSDELTDSVSAYIVNAISSEKGRSAFNRAMLKGLTTSEIQRSITSMLSMEMTSGYLQERLTEFRKSASDAVDRLKKDFEYEISDEALTTSIEDFRQTAKASLDEIKADFDKHVSATKGGATRSMRSKLDKVIEEFDSKILVLKWDIEKAIENRENSLKARLNQIEDDILLKAQDIADERLHKTMQKAVHNYIKSYKAISPTMSNREIAALNGISIREVKRRRKLHYFCTPDECFCNSGPVYDVCKHKILTASQENSSGNGVALMGVVGAAALAYVGVKYVAEQFSGCEPSESNGEHSDAN